MTNAIGTGTRNVSINVPVDEHGVYGRMAFLSGRSMGDFVRLLLVRGLEAENPEAAAQVQDIRARYYCTGKPEHAVKAVAMLLVFFGALLMGEVRDIRRSSTRLVEVVRVARREEAI